MKQAYLLGSADDKVFQIAKRDLKEDLVPMMYFSFGLLGQIDTEAPKSVDLM